MNASERIPFLVDVQAPPDDRLLATMRDVAVALQREPRVARCVVQADNFESIRSPRAFARSAGQGGAR